MTRLSDLAEASAAVAATSSRLEKTRLLAALLSLADRDDLEIVVAWLSGELRQRRIGVGWAALAALPTPASSPSLVVSAVNADFAEMAELSGPGSQTRRAERLDAMFRAATDAEQRFLRALLGGELRQGALGGVMTDAIARAASSPLAEVRRAAMLRGDLPAVAGAAMRGGASALSAFRLEVGRALAPMLAQTATSVDDALARLEGPVAFEAKLDGARIQIHRAEQRVWLFTRSLDDITARLPGVVDDVLGWPVRSLVTDGELVALRADGRARPFQDTASRVGSRSSEAGAPDRRLHAFVFDALHVDGVDLVDGSASERRAALERVVPKEACVERLVTRDAAEARAFFARMVDAGYEGVMAKSLDAPYEAGRRGAGWLKIKPVLTLDLVVLAVEWGSGRRRGRLSNIHLGARSPDGGFVMLGKTFKGMTDAMLAWQTERFLELASGPTDGHVVTLRPEQVVEIAFDGVQRSSRYPGKMALCFARVLRYRDDKAASEADTIDAVRSIHLRGGERGSAASSDDEDAEPDSHR